MTLLCGSGVDGGRAWGDVSRGCGAVLCGDRHYLAGAAMATPGYQLLLNDRLTTGKGAGVIATSHTLGYGVSALLVPLVTRAFGETFLIVAARQWRCCFSLELRGTVG